MTAIPTTRTNTPPLRWLKRAGVLGFWFFLAKGLLWLAVTLVFFYAL